MPALSDLSAPVGRLSGRWLGAGLCQLVIGVVLMFLALAAAVSRTSWPPFLTMYGAMVLASAVLLLAGVRWSWIPSLVLLVLNVVGCCVATIASLREPSGSSVEDMRPIAAMGGAVWIVGMLAMLVALASRPGPRLRVLAGWYPDPLDSGAMRFWDGEEWSEHVAPAAPWGPVWAGWYPNPYNSNEWRYWDGANWTDHTAPLR